MPADVHNLRILWSLSWPTCLVKSPVTHNFSPGSIPFIALSSSLRRLAYSLWIKECFASCMKYLQWFREEKQAEGELKEGDFSKVRYARFLGKYFQNRSGWIMDWRERVLEDGGIYASSWHQQAPLYAQQSQSREEVIFPWKVPSDIFLSTQRQLPCLHERSCCCSWHLLLALGKLFALLVGTSAAPQWLLVLSLDSHSYKTNYFPYDSGYFSDIMNHKIP